MSGDAPRPPGLDRRKRHVRRAAVYLIHHVVLSLAWVALTLYNKACALDWKFTKWRRGIRGHDETDHV